MVEGDEYDPNYDARRATPPNTGTGAEQTLFSEERPTTRREKGKAKAVSMEDVDDEAEGS